MERNGRSYLAGTAEGPALVLRAPLSFYGGVDATTGTIIDHSHPDLGRNIAGRILVIPAGRGSSSSSSVLAETIRAGTGPVGLIVGQRDPIMIIGCLVARKLYASCVPMMVCPIEGIADGGTLRMCCNDEGEAYLTSSAQTPLSNSPLEATQR